MNPLRRLFSEQCISACPARTRTRTARRRAWFLPLGESLETRRLLSTFKVNTLLDTVAVNLKTGKDASGHIRCDRPSRPPTPGRTPTRSPAERHDQINDWQRNEDNAATGDLDINGNVTIKGKGASSTIVDGNTLDRVFQVLSGGCRSLD